MPNALESLKTMTTVVADTGDIESITAYTPTDATTNPSLLYAAAQMPQYAGLVDDAVQYGVRGNPTDSVKVERTVDRLFINFGREILKIVPRYVSTEVDARLSFDTEATVAKARELIRMYEADGVSRDRILIKIASTWEGIAAAHRLENEGIRCNLTLLFGFAQAVACAEAGVYLISPFVGRILDWHKAKSGRDTYPADEDPGVISVKRIYTYYKHHGYKTLVMGASFRNVAEIKALAGCDLLTIGPTYLESLQQDEQPLKRTLSEEQAREACDNAKLTLTEIDFRWLLNEDAMATEKLAEGIRRFAADTCLLEDFVRKRIFRDKVA